MRIKSLMSAVEAAGYAMAPSEEDMADQFMPHLEPHHGMEDMVFQQPEVALRNGHAAAARLSSRPLMRLEQLLTLADPAHFQWCRDLVAGWWGGRAAA
jgi:hypothetical protein